MGFNYILNVLLFGDPSTGKEEFVNRYISGIFQEDTNLTIGIDVYSMVQEFGGKRVKMHIWNFGAEPRFKFLLHKYCKSANGAIIMYDITDLKSLDHLSEWTQIIREHAGNIPILLVGNNLDLEKSRKVPKEEGVLTAKKYNLSSCVELSSKTGQNVEKTFEILTKILIEHYG